MLEVISVEIFNFLNFGGGEGDEKLLSVQPVPEIVSLCKSFATSYIAQFPSLFKLHIPAICAVGEQ